MRTLNTPHRRGAGSRVALAAAIVLAILASATPAAQARWIRGFSDINTSGEDIAVCSGEVTIEARLDHLVSSFESFYPTFNPVVGEPYPGTASAIQSLPLFGSEADAIAPGGGTNPVLEFEIPISFVELTTSSYRFEGQQTLPTPAGFGNGDQLFARAFDETTLATIGVPLTIGDPIYDCPPEDLLWAVLPGKDRGVNEVRVDAFLTHAFVFDASSVNPRTLVVTADGVGPAAAVTYLGNIGRIGVAQVNLNATGLGCGTETLHLAGTDAGGYAYEQEIKVAPMGSSCAT